MEYKEKRSRKRKKNKVLVILLIILAVLAIGAAAVFLYITPDSAAKAQYKEEAAVLTQEITDKRLSQLGDATAAIITPSAETTDETNEVADPEPNDPTTKTPPDTETMKAALIGVYDQIMIDMQDDGMALVEELIKQAKADYKQLKKDKKNNPAAISKLATEYMSKGSALEDQMDNSFDTIVLAMQEQMSSIGIDPEPITGIYQEQYAKTKEERQKALIDKALKAIK